MCCKSVVPVTVLCAQHCSGYCLNVYFFIHVCFVCYLGNSTEGQLVGKLCALQPCILTCTFLHTVLMMNDELQFVEHFRPLFLFHASHHPRSYRWHSRYAAVLFKRCDTVRQCILVKALVKVFSSSQCQFCYTFRYFVIIILLCWEPNDKIVPKNQTTIS